MLVHGTELFYHGIALRNALKQRDGQAKDPILVSEHLHLVQENLSRVAVGKAWDELSILTDVVKCKENALNEFHMRDTSITASDKVQKDSCSMRFSE